MRDRSGQHQVAADVGRKEIKNISAFFVAITLLCTFQCSGSTEFLAKYSQYCPHSP
jgi:hypothetical protein